MVLVFGLLDLVWWVLAFGLLVLNGHLVEMVVVVGCIGGVGLICELWVQFMIYGYGFVGDVLLELDCVVVVVVDFFFFFLLLGFVVVAGGPMVEVVEVVVASGPTVEWVSMGCG